MTQEITKLIRDAISAHPKTRAHPGAFYSHAYTVSRVVDCAIHTEQYTTPPDTYDVFLSYPNFGDAGRVFATLRNDEVNFSQWIWNQ